MADLGALMGMLQGLQAGGGAQPQQQQAMMQQQQQQQQAMMMAMQQGGGAGGAGVPQMQVQGMAGLQALLQGLQASGMNVMMAPSAGQPAQQAAAPTASASNVAAMLAQQQQGGGNLQVQSPFAMLKQARKIQKAQKKGDMAGVMSAAQEVMGGAGGPRGRTASISPAPLHDRVRMEGWAEKIGGVVKNWKRRYFVMSEYAIRYFAKENERTRPKGVIALSGVQHAEAVSTAAAPVGLAITVPGRVYTLRFKEPEVRDAWLKAIQVQTQALLDKKPLSQPQAAPAQQQQTQLPQAQPQQPQPAPQQQQQAPPNFTAALVEKGGAKHALLPGQVVGLEDAVDKVRAFCNGGPSGPRMLVVHGADGCGKSTLLRELNHIANTSGLTSRAVVPGFRSFAVGVCGTCSKVLTSAKGATELFSKKISENAVATPSGSHTLTANDTCPACSAKALKIEWLALGDEEIQQFSSMVGPQPSTEVSTILLRCPNCKVTAVPMTPEGICINQDGCLFSVVGQPMPGGDSPAWRTAVPHLQTQCAQGILEHVPTIWTPEQMKQLFQMGPSAPPALGAETPMKSVYLQVAERPVLCHPEAIIGSMVAKVFAKEAAQPLIQRLPLLLEQLRAKAAEVIMHNDDGGNSQRIVFIDDIEALELAEDEDLLSWLPDPMPPLVRFVFGVSSSTPDVLTGLRKKCSEWGAELVELEISPLPEVKRQDMVQTALHELAQSAPKCPTSLPNESVNVLVKQTEDSSLALRAACGALRTKFLLDGQLDVDGTIKQLGNSVGSIINRVLDWVAEKHGNETLLSVLTVISVYRGAFTPKRLAGVIATVKGATAVSESVCSDIVELLKGPVLNLKANILGANVIIHPTVRRLLVERVSKGREAQVKAVHLAIGHYVLLPDFVAESGGRSRFSTASSHAPLHFLDAGEVGEAEKLLSDWEFWHEMLFYTTQAPALAAVKQLMALYKKNGQDVEHKALQSMVQFMADNTRALTADDTWQSVSSRYIAMAAGGGDKLPVIKGIPAEPVHTIPNVVRIFTSSTFDDLKVERDTLMSESYPHIRTQCQRMGLEFQVVDMRWGIRDESTNDHQTTNICLQEIHDAQEQSIGPDFVTFLSQRYGYRPFPAQIEKSEFETLVKATSPADAEKLRAWFQLDENRVPAEYVLQPVSSRLPDFLNMADDEARGKAKAAWWDDFSQMTNALRAAAKSVFAGDEAKQLPYTFSVTDNEIRVGVLDRSPEERNSKCLWFKRNINDLDKFIESGDKRASAFSDLVWGTNQKDEDSAAHLAALREDLLPKALEPSRVHEFDVDFAPGKGIDPDDPAHKTYLKQLVESFNTHLMESITSHVTALESERENKVFQELAQHVAHAQETARRFAGRSSYVKKIIDYIQADAPSNLPLVLFGDSGWGKTAIMAKGAEEATKLLGDNGTVMIRFCGLTPESSDIFSLLSSLHSQLCIALKEARPLPASFGELKAEVFQLLGSTNASNKIVLFLDGVNFLSDSNYGRQLEALLPARFSGHCKVIISCVPDRSEKVFPSLLKLLWGQASADDHFVQVKVLSQDDAAAILDKWLAEDGRQLVASQRHHVLAAVAQCPLPMYMALAYRVASRWSSTHAVDQSPLAASVPGIVSQILDMAERTHGAKLVERAAWYITSSLDGLSFGELEDILSLDDDALNDVFQYWQPPIRRFPPLLWVRLERDLAGLVRRSSASGVPVFRWAHRPLLFCIRNRYMGHSDTVPVDVHSSEAAAMALHMEKMKVNPQARVEMFTFKPNQKEEEPQLTKEEKQAHQQLADYFAGHWFEKEKPYTTKSGETDKADRRIAAQPDLFSENFKGEHLHFTDHNVRKLRELPFHLIKANMLDGIKQCLCNAAFVDYCILKGQTAELRKYWDYIGGIEASTKEYRAIGERMVSEARVSDSEEQKLLCYQFVCNVNTFFLDVEYVNDHVSALAQLLQDAASMGRFTSKHAQASAMRQQALCNVAVGKFPQALAILDKAFAMSVQADGPNSYLVGRLHEMRAMVYKKMGNFPAATREEQESIRIFDNYPGSSEMEELEARASAHNNLGELYLLQGQLGLAQAAFVQAKTLVEQAKGREDAMYATICNNFAALCAQINQFSVAEEHYAICINVRQTVLGSRHHLVGQAMSNLACLYMSITQATGQNRCAEAQPLLDRALEITSMQEECLDKQESMIFLRNNMAGCYQGLGQLDEALKCFEEVVRMFAESQLPQKQQYICRTQNSIAAIYIDQKRFDEAEKLLRHVLREKERLFGPTHPLTGETVECLAIVLQQTNRMQESIPLVQRVNQIKQSSMMGLM